MPQFLIFVLIVFCTFSFLSIPNLLNSDQGLIFIIEEIIGFGLLIIGYLIFMPLIKRISYILTKKYPWSTSAPIRFFIHFSILIVFSGLLFMLLLFIGEQLFNIWGEPEFFTKKEAILQAEQSSHPDRFNGRSYHKKEFSIFLYRNDILASCFLLFGALTVIQELFFFSHNKQKEKIKKEKNAKDLAHSKINVLQNQLNPHFMFNSLNVLTGLIHEDVNKSDIFIRKLSEIYRYVLVQSEEVVVTLNKEIEFAQAYIYLLKIRFEDKLIVRFDIAESKKNWFLPSMTLEMLIENAIKHNSLDKDNPLILKIYIEDDNLIVKNNYRPRLDEVMSTRFGIKNLQERLHSLNIDSAFFGREGNHYIAKIPLIKSIT